MLDLECWLTDYCMYVDEVFGLMCMNYDGMTRTMDRRYLWKLHWRRSLVDIILEKQVVVYSTGSRFQQLLIR